MSKGKPAMSDRWGVKQSIRSERTLMRWGFKKKKQAIITQWVCGRVFFFLPQKTNCAWSCSILIFQCFQCVCMNAVCSCDTYLLEKLFLWKKLYVCVHLHHREVAPQLSFQYLCLSGKLCYLKGNLQMTGTVSMFTYTKSSVLTQKRMEWDKRKK